MSNTLFDDTLVMQRYMFDAIVMLTSSKHRGYHMDNSIYDLKDYGKVIITLKDIMDSKGMTRNKLSNLTGLVYNTINRYYQSAPITSVDLDVIAKICYVLDCEVSDILKYERS